MELLYIDILDDWISPTSPKFIPKGEGEQYKKIITDGADKIEKVLKIYVERVIKAHKTKYLEKIGKDEGINKSLSYQFELLRIFFFFDIEDYFKLPEDEDEDYRYKDLEEIVNENITERPF